MEKDRERRYQSAQALLHDLQNLEDGLPLGTKIRPRREAFVATLIRKKLLIPAVVAALAIIVVAIWQLRTDRVIVAAMIENSIAVISFENLTGDESQDTLQRNIPNLLITNLENTGFFHVATWDRLRDLMKQMGEEGVETIDKELGFELCRREGIEAIVLGSVMKVGSVFATDVKVFDVETEKLIKSTSSQGEGVDSIIKTQIAELSREIALGVGISREEIASADLNISEFTTSSMDAYNYFIKGREDFYNQYTKDAIIRLEKAVELDPNFAMAHLFLGIASGLLGEGNKATECLKKAKALSETIAVTEKEKLVIDAEYANRIEKNKEKRLEILNEIVEKYPRDKWVHLELSKYYRMIEVYPEVIKHSEIVLALDPSWGDAYEELAFAYSNTGDDEKALEYLRQGSSAIPGDPSMSLTMGFFYVKMGKIDEAIRKFNDALDIRPDFNIENYIAYAYAMKEDYVETFRWIDKFITDAPSEGRRSIGYQLKGFYHYWLGNSKQAIEDLQKAWDIQHELGRRGYLSEYIIGVINYERGESSISREQFQSWHDGLMKLYPKAAQDQRSYTSSSLHLGLGLNDAREGNIDSAKSHLKEMETLLPKISSPQKRQGYNWLVGEVLLAEKSYEEAISALKDVNQMKMPWLWLTQPVMAFNLYNTDCHLALAYKENGDLDKAIDELERLTDPNPENMKGQLIYPKNYYELASLYEMKGKKAKAIKACEKFLTLWKDADMGTAELEDARKKLAGLK